MYSGVDSRSLRFALTSDFELYTFSFALASGLSLHSFCFTLNSGVDLIAFSLALRSGIQPDQIIEQLQGITCHPVWDQGSQVRSAPDALAMALKRQALPSGITVAPEFQDVVSAQLGLPMNAKVNGIANGNGHKNGHSVANGTQTRHACPECGSPTAFQEGCQACLACAWNQCGG